MAQGAPISFLPKELTHHNVRIQRERPAQRRREDEWVRIPKILGTVQRERERVTALLWLQIWVPISHDVEEAGSHHLNPFPPLLDTISCLNKLVVVGPTIIT